MTLLFLCFAAFALWACIMVGNLAYARGYTNGVHYVLDKMKQEGLLK